MQPGILIAFHGQLGSGKNEAAKQLKRFFPFFEEKAFASTLKKWTSILTGTSLETQYSQDGKNQLIRIRDLHTDELIREMKQYSLFSEVSAEKLLVDLHFLFESDSESLSSGTIQQKLGTGFRELYCMDIWVTLLFESWNPTCNWIITDLRFPNEKQAILQRYGFCIKLLGDPMMIRAQSKRDLTHISETALQEDLYWHDIIDNSTPDLGPLVFQLGRFIGRQERCFR